MSKAFDFARTGLDARHADVIETRRKALHAARLAAHARGELYPDLSGVPLPEPPADRPQRNPRTIGPDGLTDAQRRVLAAALAIQARGEVVTYAAVSREAGYPMRSSAAGAIRKLRAKGRWINMEGQS